MYNRNIIDRRFKHCKLIVKNWNTCARRSHRK